MTLRSASCSPKHTENTPITAVRKVCLSVSRRCLLCSIEQGNLWEKEMSITQLVLVSQKTRTVLTLIFLKAPRLRKWSIEQRNLWEKISPMHRLGLCLMNRDRLLSQSMLRESFSSRIPSSSRRTGTPNSTRRIMASAKRFS